MIERVITNGREKRLVPLAEVHNGFTTKDTKGSRALLIWRLQKSWAQFPVTCFDISSNFILRVLRVLRGEFSSTSGLASQPSSVLHESK